MIDLQFDTSRLQTKLKALASNIDSGISKGVNETAKDLTQEIDTFMFVPLAFDPSVEQRNNETTAKIDIRLDIPLRPLRRVKFNRFNRFVKRKPRLPGKRSWKDFVRSFVVDAKRDVTKSVSESVREEIR